jgi:hypothetical protein
MDPLDSSPGMVDLAQDEGCIVFVAGELNHVPPIISMLIAIESAEAEELSLAELVHVATEYIVGGMQRLPAADTSSHYSHV